MKSAAGIVVIGVGCTLGFLSTALAQQQQIKSQEQITRELTPVPLALRGGEQGLPTPGAAVPPPPRAVVRASVTSSGPPQAAAPVHAPSAPIAAATPQGCSSGQAAAGVASSLPAITFEFGSSQLRPEAIAQLDNLAKSLKQDLPESTSLVIEGHTDMAGTYAYNQELSLQRAQAVKDYLTSTEGVKQQLEVKGVGYCDLANPNSPRAAENRRVVIVNKAS